MLAKLDCRVDAHPTTRELDPVRTKDRDTMMSERSAMPYAKRFGDITRRCPDGTQASIAQDAGAARTDPASLVWVCVTGEV